ncbi:hypothetical protein CC80DRAFT_542168 [Byssothecium circinans]|uniref:Uncharacterized protein n=1 Tax=Byssothecium circinans TaxID=147558 RepID=A0A6A5UJB9_9PLEO|nr:hypothetical protein CC80DRAFT_542168 [Byssothecium circinans]
MAICLRCVIVYVSTSGIEPAPGNRKLQIARPFTPSSYKHQQSQLQPPKPLFLNLPYELRLEIYSYLIYPPFENSTQYHSFFSSYAQIRFETQRLAYPKLQSHLSKLISSILSRDHERELHQCPYDIDITQVRLSVPTDAFIRPEVTITIPFIVFFPEDDWYQVPWHRADCPCDVCSYYQVFVAYNKSAAGWLLDLAKPLFRLHFSAVVVRLEVPSKELRERVWRLKRRRDEGMVNRKRVMRDEGCRIVRDGIGYGTSWKELFEVKYGFEEPWCTPLGRLAPTLRRAALDVFEDFVDEGPPVNTRRICLQWDFPHSNHTGSAGEEAGSVQQVYVHHPHQPLLRGYKTVTSYTEDRMSGTSVTDLDVVDFPQWRLGSTEVRGEHKRILSPRRNREALNVKIMKTRERIRALDLDLDVSSEGFALAGATCHG